MNILRTTGLSRNGTTENKSNKHISKHIINDTAEETHQKKRENAPFAISVQTPTLDITCETASTKSAERSPGGAGRMCRENRVKTRDLLGI